MSSDQAPDLSDDSESYSIKQELFDALVAKGFSENAIKKSIVSGCVDESTCTQWITMHESHPDLDTPLPDGVTVEIKVKKVLTEEERAAKLQELKDKITAKKEEEKNDFQKRERERIKMGRQALKVKEELEDYKRKADLDAVARQKHDDEAARRRVKIQIIADRYERQGKSSEEAALLAAKEYDERIQKSQKEAEEKLKKMQAEHPDSVLPVVARSAPSTKEWDLSKLTSTGPLAIDVINRVYESPQQSPESLPSIVNSIAAHSDAKVAKECVQTLLLVLTNIRDNPFDMKKRTLRTSTNVFTSRVLPILPALELLRTVNFDLVEDAEGNHSITLTTLVLRRITDGD
ncbi:putative ubiquitin regulatory protein (ISS) [Strigomonas culicis]|uniref:Putative ubiquitin regulatory protein (ISS) n=1 Tax=Strigomonas culicis TaxID=28005 RepID=S9VWD0_9TRYP|nr:putative ubiquitin regulatory protein (ISS) [Strigomonas culicis]|eukprot:EPY31361.1 putative ubiquitin regulatory protein (ISS) [Strigomonas culicis]